MSAPETEPEPSPHAAEAAPPRRPVAVSLMSGGLDSQLAARLLAEQGVDVRALTFMTSFGCGPGEGGACGHDPAKLPMHPSIKIKLAHLGQEYIDMVMHPKHGYGKNANPCIDCRAMMLRWADEYREAIGADFLITGEVLGQRPMSQRRGVMPRIEEEAGVEGRVLRPLSAKLLPPTDAEKQGLVDRDKLCAISGRSRKKQIKLAKELGLKKWPSPAGGCLLTDPSFGRRFHDLRKHQERATVTDIDFLKIGRHFRLTPQLKVVLGRDLRECEHLEALREEQDWLFHPAEHSGPTAVSRGSMDDAQIEQIAELVAVYSKAAAGEAVPVSYGPEAGPEKTVVVKKPASRGLFAALAVV